MAAVKKTLFDKEIESLKNAFDDLQAAFKTVLPDFEDVCDDAGNDFAKCADSLEWLNAELKKKSRRKK